MRVLLKNMSIASTDMMDQIKVLVTNECNLCCTHCFRKDKTQIQMLPLSKVCEIVDFAIEHRARKLSFSGGEFFTHPYAYDILDYCLKKNIDITILTNATCLNVDYFKKYSTQRISFQVSIDGMREAHDQRRGRGNFDRMFSNVKVLKNLGFNIRASMVLDFNNYKDIINVMKLPYFDGFNCLPVAYTNDFNSALNNEEYEIRCEYDAVIAMMYKHNKRSADGTQRCHMYPMGLGIRYDGNVYPCAVSRDYDLLCMGNMMESSLKDILNTFETTKVGKLLHSYKDNRIEECEKCKSNNVCNRGCRIRAYKLFGTFDAPDLFCCRIFGEERSNSCLNNLFWGERN